MWLKEEERKLTNKYGFRVLGVVVVIYTLGMYVSLLVG